MARLITVCCFFVIGVASAGAQEEKKTPRPPRVQKAIEVVEKHLAELGGREAMLLWKEEAAIVATFPDHVFVIARFRIYPIARELPRGLSPSNIFAVSSDGRHEHLANTKMLEKFFQKNANELSGQDKVTKGLASWLTLTQEFHQDGFFKFEVLSKEFSIDKKGDAMEARGRALVTGGGNGEIAATAQIVKGKLSSVEERTKIIPGPRPRCHASKLLDADAVVRKIAEEDLLFMGLPAREYMMEQRAKAGPELREAIDRLWERMLKNGW